jgi:hypothetical protein
MIVVLVEGSGDERGLPILLKKANVHQEVSCIDMGGKSNILRLENGFERTITRQVELGRNDFAILLDRDRTFKPYSTLHEEQIGMLQRDQQLAEQMDCRVRMFWAIRAYESWLIGGLKKADTFCGLRRINKPVSGDTQASPTEPKEWLKDQMIMRRYSERIQVCLTKSVDWKSARNRNKSLRDFLDTI